MNLFYRFCRFLVFVFFKVFYRYKVIYVGKEPEEGRGILAANHVSFLDPPLVGCAFKEEVFFLARHTLLQLPVLGWAIRNLRTLPVYRGGNSYATFRDVGKKLQEEKKVVLFPEGTRSKTGELQKIKPGVALLALKASAPVIPIYVSGSYEVWPRSCKLPKIGGEITVLVGEAIQVDPFLELPAKEGQRALSDKLEEALLSLKNKVSRQPN